MVVGIGVETGLGVLRLQVSGEEDEVVGRVVGRGSVLSERELRRIRFVITVSLEGLRLVSAQWKHQRVTQWAGPYG